MFSDAVSYTEWLGWTISCLPEGSFLIIRSQDRPARPEAENIPDKIKVKRAARRDGRVAEGARLESVYTFTGIGGSNPSLSARFS